MVKVHQVDLSLTHLFHRQFINQLVMTGKAQNGASILIPNSASQIHFGAK